MRLPILALAALVLAPVAATSIAKAGDLNVTVDEVKNGQGTILGALYSSEQTFMNPQAAAARYKLPAQAGQVHYTFHNLAPGKYALSTFHDENGNGKLDKNDLGVPTEGYGFSNDAQGSGGPPKFGQAAFDFDGTTKSITVTLNY